MRNEWRAVADEAALEELLSRPPAPVVAAMRELEGDLIILGAGGKMGPSLARMARRASDAAGVSRRVIAVARFSVPAVRTMLADAQVETMVCDLLDRAQVTRLPDAPNVVFMAGQKFGTTGEAARTWAINTYLPGIVAERFAGSRIVGFSTGNVYPLWPADSEGPTESDDTGPIGEYAESALGRERVLVVGGPRAERVHSDLGACPDATPGSPRTRPGHPVYRNQHREAARGGGNGLFRL